VALETSIALHLYEIRFFGKLGGNPVGPEATRGCDRSVVDFFDKVEFSRNDYDH
jgi:hypothetical protein